MPDNTNEVNLNFKATGLNDVDRAKQTLKGYRDEVEKAKTAGDATAQALNEQLAKLAQKTVAQELGKQFGQLAVKTGDTTNAVKGLNDELQQLGLSTKDIAAAGNAFESAQNKALALAEATAKAEANARQLAEANAAAAVSAATNPVTQGIDGGGGVGSSIRLFGSQLRSLPSVQLGGGIGSDSVANIIRLSGSFAELTQKVPALAGVTEALTPIIGGAAAGMATLAIPVAAVAAAAIPLALAIKSVSDEVDRNVKSYQDELNALKQLTDFKNQNITEARKTTAAENRQEAEDQQQKIKNQQDYLTKLREQREEINREYTELGSSFDPAKRKELAGKGSEVDTAIEEATKALITLGTQAQNTVLTLGPEIDAREKETKAIEAQNKATNDRANAIVQDAAIQAKIDSEIRTLTKDQANARLQAIEDEKKNVQDQIDQLSALPNRTDEVTLKLQQLGTQMDALKQESAGLSAALNNLPAELKKAADEEAKIRKAMADTTKKYLDDTKKLEDNKNQALYESTKKYNDTLVNLAAQSAKAAEDSLRKLQEKRADLATTFGNTETDAVKKAQYKQLDDLEKYQQTEAKAARDHANDLVKIQRDQADKELDAVTNRDFKALYELQRNKQKELDAANETYNQAKADRAEAFAQQQNDAAEQFKREEEQRQVNYKRQLDQAQVAYNREVAQAQRNYNDAYQKAYTSYVNEQNILNAKYIAQQNQLNQSVTAQLQLQAQGDAAKLKLEADYYARSQQLIKGIYSNGGSTAAGGVGSGGRATATALATGGTATPGNDYRVNEPGSGGGESFSANGRSIDLPGFGVFRPSVGGTVSNNNNSKTVAVTINQSITGGRDEARLAKLAAEEARKAVIDLVS